MLIIITQTNLKWYLSIVFFLIMCYNINAKSNGKTGVGIIVEQPAAPFVGVK